MHIYSYYIVLYCIEEWVRIPSNALQFVKKLHKNTAVLYLLRLIDLSQWTDKLWQSLSFHWQYLAPSKGWKWSLPLKRHFLYLHCCFWRPYIWTVWVVWDSNLNSQSNQQRYMHKKVALKIFSLILCWPLPAWKIFWPSFLHRVNI